MPRTCFYATRLLFLVLHIVCFYGLSNAHQIHPEKVYNYPDALPRTAQQESSAVDGAVADNAVLRGVINQYKLWEVGQTLRACFFGGESQARAFVAETVTAWTGAAHLAVDFGPAPAYHECDAHAPSHIRIAFHDDGDWSAVGTDAIRGPLDKPSLNLGMLAKQPFSLVNQDRLHGTILHEFGHAFGLEHEHQSPESNCEHELLWEQVYSELAQPPNHWNKETVDHNLRVLMNAPRLRTTAYDRQSIMHYSLPAHWFRHGVESSCFVVPNTRLSATDIDTIRQAYPATVQEQARYLAALAQPTAKVLSALNVPREQQQALQAEINTVLNDALKNAGVTVHITTVTATTVTATQGVAAGQNIQGNTIIININPGNPAGNTPTPPTDAPQKKNHQ